LKFVHASRRCLLPLCAQSPCRALRVVAACPARHMVGRVSPRLAVVGRGVPLTSLVGQLQPLQPPPLAVCSSARHGCLSRQPRCRVVAQPHRVAITAACLRCIPSHVGACSLSTLHRVVVRTSGPCLPSPPRTAVMPQTRCSFLSASGHRFSIHLEHDFIF
jgi:hypothetical protein